MSSISTERNLEPDAVEAEPAESTEPVEATDTIDRRRNTEPSSTRSATRRQRGDREGGMTQIALGGVMCFVILTLSVGGMFALGSREQETRPPETSSLIPKIETVTVGEYTRGLEIEADGVVKPFRETQISAEVAGVVKFKSDACRAGRFVKKGELLLEIMPRDYELAAEQAAGQREQADRELEEIDIEEANIRSLIELAKTEVAIQEQELKRLQSVGDGTIVPASDVDKARRAYILAQNGWRSLQNQLALIDIRRSRLAIAQKLAVSREEQARLDLARTKIFAPSDGQVVSDSVETGAFVQRGTPLLVFDDTSSVEVQVNLQMDDLYWLWRQRTTKAETAEEAYQIPATPAKIYYTVSGRDDLRFSWNGILTRYDGGGIDQRTRTMSARIVVDRPRESKAEGNAAIVPPALMRGMYVTVKIEARPNARFVNIPETAVQPGNVVWRTSQRDGKPVGEANIGGATRSLTEFTIERLGPIPLVKLYEQQRADGSTERYWVTPADESGLSSGDQLARSALAGLSDGDTVHVIEQRGQ